LKLVVRKLPAVHNDKRRIGPALALAVNQIKTLVSVSHCAASAYVVQQSEGHALGMAELTNANLALNEAQGAIGVGVERGTVMPDHEIQVFSNETHRALWEIHPYVISALIPRFVTASPFGIVTHGI
jgi:hypothetical protein